jgi:DNA-binding response OmpR family regulator
VRILVVEDEEKVAAALQEGLEGEHYRVSVADSGEDAFYQMTHESFDVIILDIMLPGRNGLEVLQRIREQGVRTPVLVLTARHTLEDRVAGLNSGADDYLVKPFAFAELLARIRALLRRGRPEDALRLQTGDLELDLVTRRVVRRDNEIDLTGREYELLECLMRHAGHEVSRETLARDVWKETDRATPLNNVIDVHIARLRRKVDREGWPRLIHTIRGVGFALRDEEP